LPIDRDHTCLISSTTFELLVLLTHHSASVGKFQLECAEEMKLSWPLRCEIFLTIRDVANFNDVI
jgi:hypothetical protein